MAADSSTAGSGSKVYFPIAFRIAIIINDYDIRSEMASLVRDDSDIY